MTDRTFSDELREVLAKLGAHPFAKDRLPRKAYELETEREAQRMRARSAESTVELLNERIRISSERIAKLEQQLAEAESNIASLTRSLERVQVEHEAAVAAGLKATG